MVMEKFVCEDIGEGDTLIPHKGNDCCWRTGDRLVIMSNPSDGALFFDTNCQARYWLEDYEKDDGLWGLFVLEKRSGPW